MRVTVHLHTILQHQTPDGRVDHLQIDLDEGTLLADLLEHLEIALQPDDLLMVVNGRTAHPDQILVNGDKVNLIPAISGG